MLGDGATYQSQPGHRGLYTGGRKGWTDSEKNPIFEPLVKKKHLWQNYNCEPKLYPTIEY